ncbi:MAG: hypothetical protein IJ905_16020 [Fibrobacter sp.]|nr:hypothetical protein [Fibrobacter sp.]
MTKFVLVNRVILDLVIEAKRRGTIISCNAIGRESSAVPLADTIPIAIAHTAYILNYFLQKSHGQNGVKSVLKIIETPRKKGKIYV